ANFARARSAVDTLLTRVANQRLRNLPGFTDVRRKLLEEALAYYQQFLTERGDDPEVAREAGRAYYRAAGIRSALGAFDGAERDYRRGVEILTAAAAATPETADERRDLAGAHNNL